MYIKTAERISGSGRSCTREHQPVGVATGIGGRFGEARGELASIPAEEEKNAACIALPRTQFPSSSRSVLKRRERRDQRQRKAAS